MKFEECYLDDVIPEEQEIFINKSNIVITLISLFAWRIPESR